MTFPVVFDNEKSSVDLLLSILLSSDGDDSSLKSNGSRSGAGHGTTF